jgi:hypothetical protein
VRPVLLASLGLAAAGLPGAVLGLGVEVLWRFHARPRSPDPPIRPVLLLLLVELKSGRSALGALQGVAAAFPEHRHLERAARVATVSGLGDAVAVSQGGLRLALSQLARAQKSGASLADTVRSMVEADIAAEKTARIARARTLPVRLMIPITLLLLPGLVLLFYAPSMLRLFDELSGPFS